MWWWIIYLLFTLDSLLSIVKVLILVVLQTVPSSNVAIWWNDFSLGLRGWRSLLRFYLENLYLTFLLAFEFGLFGVYY
jgi:hypothetical protein